MAVTANKSRVFPREFNHDYPIAARGEGAYLFDTTGKAYLDGSGGAAVCCLGHNHPRIIAAIKAQLDKMAFAHTSFFTNDTAEELAQFLTDRAPEGFGRAYFLSGGSEANETAMKLARQVHLERGDNERCHFIARHQSYHGNTVGTLSLCGYPARREPFAPILMPHVSHIAPCYAYRHCGEDESLEAYGLRAAGELEKEILRVGQERVAAFFAETVVGSTLGVVTAAPGYFKEIRRICDKYGVFMVLDEVMSGMGRTGTLFACEAEGVVPDMISIAKGLGGGYQPISALLVHGDLVDTIESGSGAFMHGHTYIGHATACSAALEVQKIIEEDNLLDRVQRIGQKVKEALEQRLGDHVHVGDIRGRGMFFGVELVQDRDTKQPFPRANNIASRLKKIAMNNGLICYPDCGTMDGKDGDHIMLAPAFILPEDAIDELVDKLTLSINQTLEQN